MNRKIVLGLGNILCRDEGLGVHALKALQARLSTRAVSDLEFLDGGVLGMNLYPWIEEASHLLVLDAINANQPPGTLIELDGKEFLFHSGYKLSIHQTSFMEVLGMAKLQNHIPAQLHLIGAQPAEFSVGDQLSPAIKAVIPQMVERAETVLREWGLLTD